MNSNLKEMANSAIADTLPPDPKIARIDYETDGLLGRYPLDKSGVPGVQILQIGVTTEPQIDEIFRPEIWMPGHPESFKVTNTCLSEVMRRKNTQYHASRLLGRVIGSSKGLAAFNADFESGVTNEVMQKNLAENPYPFSSVPLICDRQIVLAASYLGNLPLGKTLDGSTSSKLEDIARVYGVNSGGHKALADAVCSEQVARIALDSVPELKPAIQSKLQGRVATSRYVDQSDFVMMVFYQKGKTVHKVFVPIDHPLDWNHYRTGVNVDDAILDGVIPDDELARIARDDRKHFLRNLAIVKPGVLVISNRDPVVANFLSAETQDLYVNRAKRVRQNHQLKNAIAKATAKRYPDKESLRFRPRRDNHIVQRFHQVTPEEKYDVSRDFSEGLERFMACRIIFDNWPEQLPETIRRRTNDYLWACLNDTSLPGATLHQRLEEVMSLRTPGLSDRDRFILDDFEFVVRRMLNSGGDYARI